MSLKYRNYLEFLMGQEKDVVKEISVAGGVIVSKTSEGTQRILLIKRSKKDHWPNIWEFPRGKCDHGPNEKLFPCLKREVYEETGLHIEPIKFIDKYEYIADEGKRRSTQYNYLCRMDDQKQKVKLSKEHDEFMWIMSFGEVELLVPSEMKKTISKVLNLDKKIVDYPENDNSEETIEEYLKGIQ